MIPSRSTFRLILAALALAWGGAVPLLAEDHPEAVREKRGFKWEQPPGLVQVVPDRRWNMFFVGEAVAFNLSGPVHGYEVRDYWGTVVEEGKGKGKTLPLAVRQPGWYKIYLFGEKAQPPWGDIIGGTTFVIFRPNANFPKPPAVGDTFGGTYPSMDEPLRGVCGIGPQRIPVHDLVNTKKEIERLQKDVDLDRTWYLPFDPARKRALLFAFPEGTAKLDGVRVIAKHFKDAVKYWEPRNEPNGGASGADFARKEMKPFYETIKGVDRSLKVIGPGTVEIRPGMLNWIDDFLKAGGGECLDAFSFHIYNCSNGDVALTRKSMEELGQLLKRYHLEKIEKWQTEQGYMATYYGVYTPRAQARGTMVQLMVYEQYGLPKEHNHLWYDRSHGFWDFPTFIVNDDGSLNPGAAVLRVYAEELFGTTFAKAFAFGPAGDKIYVGNLFTGKQRSVAAFMSAGCTDGLVTLSVTGGKNLRLVSALGVESDLEIVDGKANLPVAELPVYVELAEGQSLQVVPMDYGPNLARKPGVKIADSSDGSYAGMDKMRTNDHAKVVNGELENWCWQQTNDSDLWMCNSNTFPQWLEITLPAPTPVAHVIIYSGVPGMFTSTMIDYELQVDDHGAWKTVERVTEPTRVVPYFTPIAHCTIDSFFSDRCIFIHHLAKPVTTGKIRILAHDTTYGGGTDQRVTQAGAMSDGFHCLQLREVEIYGPKGGK